MKLPAKVHQDRLDELKDYVEDWHNYFNDNIERYNYFRDFVFKSSLSSSDIATLEELGKPTLEFNNLEAIISKQRGEFAKHQPSLSVRAADGLPAETYTDAFTKQLEIIEAHLRSIFFDGSNDMMEYNVYTDLLSGGFSAMRVATDYVNEMSFEQNIYVERVFDPTLTGFDPLARESHKGDGRYCFEMYPLTREEFEARYNDTELTAEMSWSKNIDGFGWSYKTEKEDVVLLCDFYLKVKKQCTVVLLSNGKTVKKEEYKKALAEFEEMGMIEQPPIIVKERSTEIETIERYVICENTVLDHAKTNYKHLPVVFVDGNSIILSENQTSTQYTRPYVYHAEGIQKLRNFAGQTLANELENMVMHKFMASIEGIPTDYTEAYDNIQKQDVLIYKHFYDENNPETVLPPPQVIQRTPIPPQVTETFMLSENIMQQALGNYDNKAGIDNGTLSGVAFARSAIQSNNASLPYIVGFIKGLNRLSQIIIDLIPKYYRTPRSLPILKESGKREYVIINKKPNVFLDYDSNWMKVNVEVGVNFAMQKEIALQTITQLMSHSELFAEFMNTEGLEALLDNIDIRGIEELKKKAAEFMGKAKQIQEQKSKMAMQQSQMQQQEQQMAMQKMQAELKASSIQLQNMIKDLQGPTQKQIEMMKMQQKNQIDIANIEIKDKDSETKRLETISNVQNADIENELKMAQIEAETERTKVDAAIAMSKHLDEKLSVDINDNVKE